VLQERTDVQSLIFLAPCWFAQKLAKNHVHSKHCHASLMLWMSKMGWGFTWGHLAFNHERQKLAYVEVRATLNY
jgi:hypothetical protein